ncbi:MAG: P1 family peptidase [Candidatus Longimicrobiales bacterium M2_2A_002]
MSAITDVPGIRVGHAGDDDARTGCTVVLGPFRAAHDARGAATGTRELATASPHHLVPRIDAILLTGGSAFGLAAADGVMAWLEEQGEPFGFDTGVARVPIVPAAVIFDLDNGVDRRPDAAMGRAACEVAGTEVAEGAVGAGTGATVGTGRGPGEAMPGGVGTAAVVGSGWTVGALVVVNALGDVLDSHGRIIAGTRGPDGAFLDSARLAREAGSTPAPGTNTTLCVVATDAPLDRMGLAALARAGSTGMARRISPAHTPFDGDVVFAVSNAGEPRPGAPEQVLALSALAAEAVAEAIERAVSP